MQGTDAAVGAETVAARSLELDAHPAGLLGEGGRAGCGEAGDESERTNQALHDRLLRNHRTTSRVRLPIGPTDGGTTVPSAAWNPDTISAAVRTRCMRATSVAGAPRVPHSQNAWPPAPAAEDAR